jgi:protein tyrosine phosphatase (PTP) superfamily phosphohydrolase (DUF442 family)
MTEKIEITIQHRGRTRGDLKSEVMQAEREAVEKFGGPVVRFHKFVDGGERCTFIWTRKPE